jgi:YggT family protein
MVYFISLISQVVGLYSILLIVYIFMSWVPSTRETAIGRILERICEPYLDPFRRIIPPFGMIDVSPIVAILVLRLAQSGLVYLKTMF